MQLHNPSTKFGFAAALTSEDLTNLFTAFPAPLTRLILHGTAVQVNKKATRDDATDFTEREEVKADKKVRIFSSSDNAQYGHDNVYEHPRRFENSLASLADVCVINTVTTPEKKSINRILSKVHTSAHINYLEKMAAIAELVGCPVAIDIADPWHYEEKAAALPTALERSNCTLIIP